MQGEQAYSKGLILYLLKFEDVGGSGVGVPEGAGTGKDGVKESSVGEGNGFLLVPPGDTSKGFEDLVAGGSVGGDTILQ